MKSGKLTSWNPLGHSRPVTGLLLLSDEIHKNFLDKRGECNMKTYRKIFKHVPEI